MVADRAAEAIREKTDRQLSRAEGKPDELERRRQAHEAISVVLTEEAGQAPLM